jgi:hypothetical protein
MAASGTVEPRSIIDAGPLGAFHIRQRWIDLPKSAGFANRELALNVSTSATGEGQDRNGESTPQSGLADADPHIRNKFKHAATWQDQSERSAERSSIVMKDAHLSTRQIHPASNAAL